MQPEHYLVETPENVTFQYAVAGIGSRFLAATVDTLLILIFQVALMLFLFAYIDMVSVLPNSDSLRSFGLAMWGMMSFLFFWGYYITFEHFWNGQTPGKRWVKVRVVREGGRPITFVAAFIRNLVRIIDFLPGLYGFGVLVMFIDTRSRRLGDFAAGTIVVKEHAAALSLDHIAARVNRMNQVNPANPASPASPANPAKQVNPANPANHPPVPDQAPVASANLSEKDYALIQEFLQRRRNLRNSDRAKLARQLADRFRQQVDIPFDPQRPEAFLEQITAAYRSARTVRQE